MTRRLSLRASAREIYGGLAQASTEAQKSAPTPDPSPRFADARGGGEENDLTTRVRALYESSAVPVAEIARLVGVSERTIYKYVAKQNWQRRYAGRGEAAGQANRGRRWQRAAGHEPVKGAGGRFIARADADKPIATGLKATDPAGAAQASSACAAASRLSDIAQARALRHKRTEARLRALNALNRALAGYNGFRKAQARSAAKAQASKKQAAKMKIRTDGKGGRPSWRPHPPWQPAWRPAWQRPPQEPSKEPSKQLPKRPAAKTPSRQHLALENLHVLVIETALRQVQALV